MKRLRWWGVGLALASCVLGSCQEHAVVGQAPGSVPKGAFALVGQQILSSGLLSRALESRKPEAEAIIRGVLFGEEAKRVLPYRTLAVQRGALSRSLLQQIERDLERDQAVTEEEMTAERKKQWLRYDRPRAVRAAQFLVRVPMLSNDDDAYALAQKIQETVKGANNAEEFAALGKAVPAEIKVIVEIAPSLAADGRVVPLTPEEARFASADPDFARAVTALSFAGDISEVVATAAGYHVLYAMEVFPPVVLPDAEARIPLKKAILAERVRGRLEELKAKQPTQVVREGRHLAAALRPLWRRQ